MVIRFERDNKANALSRQVKKKLTEAARSSENDFETSAIVLMGRDDLFSLGRDLKDPSLADIEQLGLAERRKAIQVGPRLTKAFEEVEPVTFAPLKAGALVVALPWRRHE